MSVGAVSVGAENILMEICALFSDTTGIFRLLMKSLYFFHNIITSILGEKNTLLLAEKRNPVVILL